MIVCQCKGITDRHLRAVVRLGYDTVERVTRACGAGTECGGCLPTIAAIVQQERLLMSCERNRALHPTSGSTPGPTPASTIDPTAAPAADATLVPQRR